MSSPRGTDYVGTQNEVGRYQCANWSSVLTDKKLTKYIKEDPMIFLPDNFFRYQLALLWQSNIEALVLFSINVTIIDIS